MENGQKSAFTGIVNEAVQPGLTKREYFAGLAMQGIMSSRTGMRVDYVELKEVIAREAVSISDALLKELDKSKSE